MFHGISNKMINDDMICNVQYRGKSNNREGEFVHLSGQDYWIDNMGGILWRKSNIYGLGLLRGFPIGLTKRQLNIQ